MNAKLGIYQQADEPCMEIDLAPTSQVMTEVDTMMTSWVNFKASTQSLSILDSATESKTSKCAWAIARLSQDTQLTANTSTAEAASFIERRCLNTMFNARTHIGKYPFVYGVKIANQFEALCDLDEEFDSGAVNEDFKVVRNHEDVKKEGGRTAYIKSWSQKDSI